MPKKRITPLHETFKCPTPSFVARQIVRKSVPGKDIDSVLIFHVIQSFIELIRE